MSEDANYDQFLERLELDVQRLDTDFRNYLQLWEMLDEHLDDVNEAPGTFTSFINALRTSTVVLTTRLFDKGSGDVGLRKLIATAENHLNDIDWQGNSPSLDDLQSQRDRITGLADVLSRLKIQRNKAYAHLDKKHVIDPEAFAGDNPLSSDDLRQAIDLAQAIVQEHYRWRNGSHLEMRIPNGVNVRTLLDLIRIGRQYRTQDFEERTGG